MSRRHAYVFESLGLGNRLERRLSLSGIAIRQPLPDDGHELPPPKPEDDPGPYTPDPPIVYPTLPPTGPEGPG